MTDPDARPGPPPVRAVLLDFAGTLLVPEEQDSWVAAVHPDLSAGQVADLADRLVAAGRAGGPEPVALPPQWEEDYARRDLSPQRHRELYLGLMGGVAGLDGDRAQALYERGTTAEGWSPYPDAAPVLQALRGRGVAVAVVSNVGFDLRAVFVGHGLDTYVDHYALSYEVGVMKPDPALFTSACAALRVEPAEAVMVGDNPRADGAAVDLGIRTLLLPYSPAGADHGLDALLRLLP